VAACSTDAIARGGCGGKRKSYKMLHHLAGLCYTLTFFFFSGADESLWMSMSWKVVG
jgi:hypothetical protein